MMVNSVRRSFESGDKKIEGHSAKTLWLKMNCLHDDEGKVRSYSQQTNDAAGVSLY